MELGAFEILAGIGLLIYCLYYYYTMNFDYWQKRNIKGPKPVPFFGNFKDTILGKKHNAELIKEIYEEFKNEPIVGVFVQRKPALITIDAEYIKDVLIKDFHVFADRGINIVKDVEPLSQHLFSLEPDRWRPLRSRLSPVFTSGKLKEMFYLINECGEHFEKYIDVISRKHASVEVRELAAKFTTDSIGMCAFGLNMNSLAEEDSEFRKIGRSMFESSFFNTIRRLLRDMSPRTMRLLKPIIYNKRMNSFFIGLMKDTIEYREKNNIKRHDFVDMLIELKNNPEKLHNIEFDDTLLASQAFVFFAAGFETSSTTISNALLEMALNPDIQEKLRKEIREEIKKNNGITYEGIKNMKLLDKVFKETLRKYPPGTMLIRKSTKEYTFNGTELTIPKGSRIFIPVYSIQHDPNIYPNPEKFDPERFDPELEKQRHPMHFLPFGDGPRNCIGARFAIFQSKLGILKVIENYSVSLSEEMQIPYKIDPRGFVLAPIGGIHLKIKKIE